MIIVSNVNTNKTAESYLSYDDFIRKACEEGLDIDSTLAININDLEEEIFEQLVDNPDVLFFTLNGKYPNFASNYKIENWSESEPQNNNNDVDYNVSNDSAVDDSISDLLNGVADDDCEMDFDNFEREDAKIYVFGSSKGGTGKTFTSIISTYRYAKTHPNERIALVDFDIIDGQVGISIHKIKPTMGNYYIEYQKGYKDFDTMRRFAVKGNHVFPKNVDFYLAPSAGSTIENTEFWINIIQNCIENYDVVIFDTGIDYLNIEPISYAYKIADKINIVTTTSIKSVNSVIKQISRLKGEISSKGRNGVDVFTKEDEIGPRLNIIITQMLETNKMNRQVYANLSKKANVIATFGVITDSVSRAEYFGEWDVFDRNSAINKSLDNIMV